MLGYLQSGSRALVLLLFCLACSPLYAFPVVGEVDGVLLEDVSSDHAFAHGGTSSTKLAKRAPSFYARIMPMGASIVDGWTSHYGDGFRKLVRDALRQAGWEVNMVGRMANGTMADNQFTAVPGYRIDQIYNLIASDAGVYLPNIILLLAGTNDCIQLYDIPNIGSRMNTLLDYLYAKSPGVTIVMSTVIPSNNATADGQSIASVRDAANQQYRALAATRIANGDRLVLSDADTYMTSADIGTDGIHPTQGGYQKLASLWYAAINYAYNQSMLVAPTQTSHVDDSATANTTSNQCATTYGAAVGPVNNLDGTNGADDGTYDHTTTGMGVIFTLSGYSTAQTFWTAKLVNNTYDDVIQWTSAGKYQWYQNNKAGSWGSAVSITVPDTCPSTGVRWADVNGDGLDDFVCIDTSGNAYVSINNGRSSATGPPTFTYEGEWKPSEGAQNRVRLVDIDGDGRFDYCIVADDDSVSCWRNGGVGNIGDPWQPLGVVFQGSSQGDIAGVIFSDINGDGRSDWMWLNDQGGGTAYTNNRACTQGALGAGLVPNWRQANSPTFGGMGTAGARANVHFARIYGQVTTFGMLPPHDYLWIEQSATTPYSYSFHSYKNTGLGGTKLKGDGVRFCNMMGHATKQDDYVWVYQNGVMVLYQSFGEGFPPVSPYWFTTQTIFNTGRNLDRRDLHLVDWDGDGACDIVYVEPTAGTVEVWLNQILATGDFNWNHISNPAPALTCNQTRGVGIFDIAVRFADLTGNNLPDYLCMQKDGLTTGFLQTSPGTWQNVGQIKKSESLDRANFRWADINADGRADLLWLDKFSGDTTAYLNMGNIPTAGSYFLWSNQGIVLKGQGQGACQHFPDLDGDGRADLQLVQADTNIGEVWYNECTGYITGGDDVDTLTVGALPLAPSNSTS
ncbi:hypothetical protein BX600DRAFT_550581 [Xylariales sp. PMI_506]|nr:hypothetical protein BX600DRAFT_550581 [Xylariales sp. PMI_506]